MKEVITGVVLTKDCSIKADADSTETRRVILRVKFDGATLQGVFDKALAGTVIAWQNGVGRKNFDTYKNGQTVEVQFTSPARTAIDPEAAMVAKLQTMTPAEQVAYLKELTTKAAKA